MVSGAVVHATGPSGIIVRGRSAIFVESVEEQRGRGIAIVDPADVKLVPDSSPGYEDTMQHLEAAFRKSAPTGRDTQVAGKAAIDDIGFQLDHVRPALRAPRVRILVADGRSWGQTTSKMAREGKPVAARMASE